MAEEKSILTYRIRKKFKSRQAAEALFVSIRKLSEYSSCLVLDGQYEVLALIRDTNIDAAKRLLGDGWSCTTMTTEEKK
jgi:hypothetical protein